MHEENQGDVKAIAFHLPQFHEIPENNEWWGEGFTEWTNTKRAKPYFKGHYQPHVPHEDIGYYNLLERDIKKKQIEMAKTYGIYGFCYYYYWFHGKRLLEKPLYQILEDKSLDFPFCLCWANETWSKRWDGKDHEILIEQRFSPEDDIDFIQGVIPFFKDDRYIRINGRPVLLVWRSEKLPDPMATVNRWQEEVKKAGLPPVYLIRVESHATDITPSDHGFDASVDFAPNGANMGMMPQESQPIDAPKSMNFFDYLGTMHNIFERVNVTYKRFQGVFVSWDNVARKKDSGNVYLNSSPESFQYLLSRVAENTKKNFDKEERLLFINAWNEWAEGCHLEPDEKYGYEFLEACKRVLLPSKDDIAWMNSTRDYLGWLEKKTSRVIILEQRISTVHKWKSKILFAVFSPRKFFKKRILRKDI